MANIEDWLAENYTRAVAAGERSFEDIADTADKNDAPELAAWARAKAAKSGKNVTPIDASADESADVKRNSK